ncbi:MAG: hypothetical protein QM296_11415 [Bacillota bacterium]|nr:hypothetical protein [Bacillota bacterium]
MPVGSDLRSPEVVELEQFLSGQLSGTDVGVVYWVNRTIGNYSGRIAPLLGLKSDPGDLSAPKRVFLRRDSQLHRDLQKTYGDGQFVEGACLQLSERGEWLPVSVDTSQDARSSVYQIHFWEGDHLPDEISSLEMLLPSVFQNDVHGRYFFPTSTDAVRLQFLDWLSGHGYQWSEWGGSSLSGFLGTQIRSNMHMQVIAFLFAGTVILLASIYAINLAERQRRASLLIMLGLPLYAQWLDHSRPVLVINSTVFVLLAALSQLSNRRWIGRYGSVTLSAFFALTGLEMLLAFIYAWLANRKEVGSARLHRH